MRALLTVFACFACAALAACEDTRGSLGEECLRDQDCRSEICSARICITKRPTTPNLPAPFEPGADAAVIADANVPDRAGD
jgi:hypothetical protein